MNRLTWLWIVLLAASPGIAQTCRMSIPVSVSDSHTSRPLTTLNKNSFVLSVGKQRIVPDQATFVAAKRAFVFLDGSGSMSSPKKWAAAVQATGELVTLIPSKLPVSVDVFSDHDRHLSDRSEVLPYLRSLWKEEKRIGGLGGKTRLYDTLFAAARREDMGLEDVVIVISDGGDNNSKTTDSALRKEFQRRGIRLFFLFIWSSPDSPEESTAHDTIPKIVGDLGGTVTWITSIQRDKPVVPLEFYANALTYYRLGFDNAEFQSEKIKVETIDGQRKKLKAVSLQFSSRAPLCPTD